MLIDMSHSATAARYVPRSGATWADPWPMYAALREFAPVHHVEQGDYWVLSRHADVYTAARDPETYSSANGLTIRYDELDKIGMRDAPPMVMTDPPAHTEFRRLVSRGFTPRQVESVEPAVRAFVAERLDRLVANGGGDIVQQLFKPLPSMVVAHYLGVPKEDRDRFDGWTDAIVAANAEQTADAAGEAVAEMSDYFAHLVRRRRVKPEDDTVSHLVMAGKGDDPADLVKVLGFTFTMVTGGNDTTTGLLGAGVQLLSERPDQLGRVLDDVPAAVEELLRLTAPVQGMARTVTRDVELHGVQIPSGRKVLLLYAAANRDPRVYGPDADDLDVTRRPRQILTFSHGPHHCLGAAAARMMGRVALEELLTRIPKFRVDAASVVWAPGHYVRRPLSVGLEVAA